MIQEPAMSEPKARVWKKILCFYALTVYLITWITGLGGFNMSILPKVAADFGWQNFSPALTLVLFVLITATLGMVGKLSRALGEEIGWRGFLVPELAKVVGFPGI